MRGKGGDIRTIVPKILLLFIFLWVLPLEGAYKVKRRPPKPRVKRTYQNPWLFGGHFGLDFAFAKATPDKRGSTRTGVVFGVSLEKRLSGNFYIQPEFRFVQKGVKTILVDFEGIAEVSGTIKLDSLQVPVFLRYKTGSPRLRFVFGLGPAFSLAVKREISVAGIPLSLSSRFTFVDLSAQATVGIEFLVMKNVLATLQLRYSHGIPDIDKQDSTFRTREIELSAGFVTRI